MNTRQTKCRSPYGTWKCSRCNLIFETRAKLFKHNHETHPVPKGQAWNKGLTKETDERIKRAQQKLKANYKNHVSKIWCEGKHLSKETKERISNGMKRAHQENRAHNIGECRWNNKPSYPEQWFIKVIENEFTNKEYIREYPFTKYSLDFAWPKLKKCIEIDGEQHERFQDYKDRDTLKDKLLIESGWQVLRLPWKEVFRNTKYYIKVAKEFIENK